MGVMQVTTFIAWKKQEWTPSLGLVWTIPEHQIFNQHIEIHQVITGTYKTQDGSYKFMVITNGYPHFITDAWLCTILVCISYVLHACYMKRSRSPDIFSEVIFLPWTQCMIKCDSKTYVDIYTIRMHTHAALMCQGHTPKHHSKVKVIHQGHKEGTRCHKTAGNTDFFPSECISCRSNE